MKNSDDLPYDVCDWAKSNKNYVNLLEEMKISEATNEEIYHAISERYGGINLGVSKFTDYFESSIDNENINESNKEDDSDTRSQIIYAHKFKKWSLNSISAYYWMPKLFVLQTIKDFQSKLNKKHKLSVMTEQRHKKISFGHIESVREFMNKNRGKHITVEDI